jgi:CRP-like cAMP-binding protein
MTALQPRTQQLLHSLPFFKSLPETDIRSLVDAGTIHKYSKNQHLYFHGDRAETLFIILSGCVKTYSQTIDGEETVIDLITEGHMAGEATIFDGGIYPFSACAAERCEVFELSAALLKKQAKASPELSAKIMNILADEVIELQQNKEHMAIMSAPQRAGCMLLKLSSNMIGKGGTFLLPYDKSLAASNIGIKPETVSRALKELRAYGVTVKGSEITIENFTKLAEHCCIHCSSMSRICVGSKRLDSLSREAQSFL